MPTFGRYYTGKVHFLLEHRMKIQQSNSFLKDLVRSARSGALVPAAFQRPYVWTKTDVISLLESLLKGYPIGSFLLWTPYGKANLSHVSRPRLGPVVPSSAEPAESLLLDGQNRLASLAWAWRTPDQEIPPQLSEQEALVWGSGEHLVVNLETKSFEFASTDTAEQGMRLPVYALFDSRLANPLIRERWHGSWQPFGESAIEAAVNWFDKTEAAFSDARTIVTDMQGASAEEAQDAFLHICKTGVPMSEQDFKTALAWLNPSAQ